MHYHPPLIELEIKKKQWYWMVLWTHDMSRPTFPRFFPSTKYSYWTLLQSEVKTLIQIQNNNTLWLKTIVIRQCARKFVIFWILQIWNWICIVLGSYWLSLIRAEQMRRLQIRPFVQTWIFHLIQICVLVTDWISQSVIDTFWFYNDYNYYM